MNNKPDIKHDTKEKILKTATELNYRPSRFARGLRSNTTGTIGVIIADITNPFFGSLVKGIEEQASEKGYSIILCDTGENTTNEKRAIQLMLQEKVDGILLTPSQENDEDIKFLKKQQFPFVLIARHFEQLSTDYVVADDTKGGFLATKHLIEQGCNRILHIKGPDHISSAKERLTGYKQALEEHNIPFSYELVTEPAITMEGGFYVANRAISSSKDIDGIFAFSDYVALGVLKAVQQAGLRVPENIAIVGYDDIDFASCLETPLTTVRMPKKELGHKAFDLLYKRIKKEIKEPSAGIKLDVELVIRKSSTKLKM